MTDDNYEALIEKQMQREKDMKSKKRFFKFEDTIAWDSLTSEETTEWKRVAEWVSWFCNTVPNIKEEYEISKNKGTDLTDIKRGIMLNYLYSYLPTTEDSKEVREKKSAYVNSLTDYLLNCFEQIM